MPDGEQQADEAARVEAVSAALEAARAGDEAALGALFTAVYDDLRRLAHAQRRRWSGNETLDTTALLHESYLRLVDRSRFGWADLGHFFAVACRAMRHILIDYARGQKADKRGGEAVRVALGDAAGADEPSDPRTVLALCRGLERLAEADPRRASVFELRCFLGLGVEETAELLGVSPATVKRDWLLASSFLRLHLEE